MAELNDELKLGFTGDHLLNAWQTIPAWPAEELRALVLVARIPSSTQQRFESGWKAIQRSGMAPASAGLQWVVVNLGANRAIRPDQVAANDLVEGAVMWAGALHPDWVRSMDGDNVPYAYMGEYQVQIRGYAAWSASPYLFFSRSSGQVRLLASDGTHSTWAVPVRE